MNKLSDPKTDSTKVIFFFGKSLRLFAAIKSHRKTPTTDAMHE